ncbi:SdpI family protein [Chitinophaga defluvii]|uniref:SdpI family protein n=1 Tax=Chitinophaga defluvii TaxID=3163343 RepID=A0ABV2SZR2_9BACT
MKESKWLKEAPLVILICCPGLVYLYLKHLLPDLLPTHYTVDAAGKWVVDGQSGPLSFVISMLLGSVIVYGALSLPAVLQRLGVAAKQQTIAIGPVFYVLKVGILLLLNGIPVYTMLVAAGKITGGSAAMLAYTGGVFVLLLFNLFVYRLYSRMYHTEGARPLSGKPYIVLWVATHVIISIGPLCILLAPGGLNAGKMIPQFVLVFLAVCGNLLYSVKPNLYLGIRTPWTLRNETVWRKTHRIGGIVFFICGTAGFLATLLADGKQVQYIFITVLAITTLIPVLYSYLIYKKITAQP